MLIVIIIKGSIEMIRKMDLGGIDGKMALSIEGGLLRI